MRSLEEIREDNRARSPYVTVRRAAYLHPTEILGLSGGRLMTIFFVRDEPDLRDYVFHKGGH